MARLVSLPEMGGRGQGRPYIASGSRVGTHSVAVLVHVYVAGQTALSVSAQMDCELRDGDWGFCLRILRQIEELAEG